jgi:hypothetical protein
MGNGPNAVKANRTTSLAGVVVLISVAEVVAVVSGGSFSFRRHPRRIHAFERRERSSATRKQSWHGGQDGPPALLSRHPASCIEAQATVRAKRFYSIADDGLKQEWAGRVWLNPPFSHPLNIHFVNKLIAEVASGRVSEAILLVNILPSGWLQDALEACSAVCFSRDRLRFTHRQGAEQQA